MVTTFRPTGEASDVHGSWQRPNKFWWSSLHVSELRRLGIDGRIPRRLHASRVQGVTVGLPIIDGCLSAPVPEGGGARNLRRVISERPAWSTACSSSVTFLAPFYRRRAYRRLAGRLPLAPAQRA